MYTLELNFGIPPLKCVLKVSKQISKKAISLCTHVAHVKGDTVPFGYGLVELVF